jgi:hypothetical protein
VSGGEGGKKNDPTVPIVIGIGLLLLVLLFGGCGNINLPTYGPGTGGYHGSNGYQCDRSYGGGNCRGQDNRGDDRRGDDRRGDDRRGSGHERRHPRATDDPDPTPGR